MKIYHATGYTRYSNQSEASLIVFAKDSDSNRVLREIKEYGWYEIEGKHSYTPVENISEISESEARVLLSDISILENSKIFSESIDVIDGAPEFTLENIKKLQENWEIFKVAIDNQEQLDKLYKLLEDNGFKYFME